MRAISSYRTYECPKPIMVIAGAPFHTVRLSISVFEAGNLLLQRVLEGAKAQARTLSAQDPGSITTSIALAKALPIPTISTACGSDHDVVISIPIE